MVHHAGRYIPKISDFGISKQLEDGESSLVSNSVLGGTRSFASPEQLCEREIRKNTDLWSFGVIAYYMLVGELPFTTGTLSASSDEGRSEQLRQILSGRLPEKINGVSEPWFSVIRSCLIVDGTKRLQHAEDCLCIISDWTAPAEVEAVVEDTVGVVAADIADEKTAVVVESDTTHIDNAVPAEQPKIDAPSDEQSTPSQPTKKSKLWLWMLLLLVVVGGVIALNGGGDKENVKGKHNGYEWVDLGLSVKWATCNIGAENPEDYGNYYAWGETSTKSIYTADKCETWEREIDNIKGTNCDVAHVKWGGSWRMPTKEEFDELREKCNWKWTGSGYEVTGPNGNSIYLPATGYRGGETLNGDGLDGSYWSSTPVSESTHGAYCLRFGSGVLGTNWEDRGYGCTVRPVLE
jgi:hypothetical protein